MKVTKYLAPPMDVVIIGPYTSEYTIFKSFVVHPLLSFGNAIIYYLLSMHISQNNEDVEQEFFSKFKLLSMFWSI